jgi:Fe-S-cluster containining protein
MTKPKLKTVPVSSAAGFVALQMLHSPTSPPTVSAADGGPCHLCNASCCRYFALHIDTPADEEDYDHIRWYLMHEGVSVWVQDDDWYLEVRTVCRHLQLDKTCGIYETRPQICRDYGLPGADPCEYFTTKLDYDLQFFDDAQFDEWTAEQRKKKRSGKKRK